MSSEADLRASARRSWTVRVYDLGAEPDEDLSGSTTVQERLAMMWPLALEAWRLSGRELPEYERAEMPVAVRPL